MNLKSYSKSWCNKFWWFIIFFHSLFLYLINFLNHILGKILHIFHNLIVGHWIRIFSIIFSIGLLSDYHPQSISIIINQQFGEVNLPTLTAYYKGMWASLRPIWVVNRIVGSVIEWERFMVSKKFIKKEVSILIGA